MIGVNGIDLSGKTTFATNLAQALTDSGRNVVLVHLDDFLNPLAVRMQNPDPVETYMRHAFDLERLEAEVLRPLREAGELDAAVDVLNPFTDEYEEQRHYAVRPESIVVIEGVLLFRAPIDDYLDHRVFLRVAYEEALRRAQSRDVDTYGEEILQRYREKYFPAHEQYAAEWQPEAHADLVIDNTRLDAPRIVSDAKL